MGMSETIGDGFLGYGRSLFSYKIFWETRALLLRIIILFGSHISDDSPSVEYNIRVQFSYQRPEHERRPRITMAQYSGMCKLALPKIPGIYQSYRVSYFVYFVYAKKKNA